MTAGALMRSRHAVRGQFRVGDHGRNRRQNPARGAGGDVRRAWQEYASEAHPPGFLVNSEPVLDDNRAHNLAITAALLRDSAAGTGTITDLETLAAYGQATLVGLSTCARDDASKEQLGRVAALALMVPIRAGG